MAKPLPKFRSRAQRTAAIVLAWCAVGALAAFFIWVVTDRTGDRNALYDLLHHHLLRSLWWGLIGGGAYIFLLRDRLRALPYFSALGIMSLLVLFAVSIYMVWYPQAGYSGPGELSALGARLRGAHFWAEFIYRDMLMAATIFSVRLRDQIGAEAYNLIFGRRSGSRQELRIFLFIDMRSSTTIAEHIGDTRYFKLLNEVFADITDPVIYSGGDIYQYVGDEISVSWPLQRGIKEQRCLRCFFAIRSKLQQRAAHYKRIYGTVPVFKAGLHYGQVTTGRIGLVKKQTIYSGDVVNTASHIQAACNEHDVDILLSKELLDVLALDPQQWTVRSIGDVPLKGKRRSMQLFTVEPGR